MSDRPPAFVVKVLASAMWPLALAISVAVAGVDWLARRIISRRFP